MDAVHYTNLTFIHIANLPHAALKSDHYICVCRGESIVAKSRNGWSRGRGGVRGQVISCFRVSHQHLVHAGNKFVWLSALKRPMEPCQIVEYTMQHLTAQNKIFTTKCLRFILKFRCVIVSNPCLKHRCVQVLSGGILGRNLPWPLLHQFNQLCLKI